MCGGYRQGSNEKAPSSGHIDGYFLFHFFLVRSGYLTIKATTQANSVIVSQIFLIISNKDG